MQKVRLLLILSFFALSANAQDRGPLNKDLPSWITLSIQTRWRSEGQHGLGFVEGQNEDFLLERSRLSVGIAPFSWLGFQTEVQDARSFGLEHPDSSVRDVFDLRQAYVRAGREDGWWDVKGGRQKLVYGSERVVGAAEWGNTARIFDAIKLGIHHGADLLTSLPVRLSTTMPTVGTTINRAIIFTESMLHLGPGWKAAR